MKPLPAKRDLTLSYRTSLIVAALMAFAGGLLLGSGGLYGSHPTHSLGVTEADAGLLLLGSLWLTSRGSLIGLLFYALYWYVLYLTGAPFSATSIVLLAFGIVCCVPLAFFVRGTIARTDGVA